LQSLFDSQAEKLIAQICRPALALAHNKTLAVQLCNELREVFTNNYIEYFISCYNYPQLESYALVSNTYFAKIASINEEAEMSSYSVFRALFERRDLIILASISYMYGLGIPSEYLKDAVKF